MTRPLLILESPWYSEQNLSTRRLYQGATQAYSRDFSPAPDLLRISRLAQYSAVLVLSGHGELHQGRRLLLTEQGYVNIESYLKQIPVPLNKLALILDACHIAHAPEQLRASLGLQAVIGFSKQVNWHASSVLMLALLRRLQQLKPHQDAALLAHMASGEYLHLFQRLGLVWSIKQPHF